MLLEEAKINKSLRVSMLKLVLGAKDHPLSGSLANITANGTYESRPYKILGERTKQDKKQFFI